MGKANNSNMWHNVDEDEKRYFEEKMKLCIWTHSLHVLYTFFLYGLPDIKQEQDNYLAMDISKHS